MQETIDLLAEYGYILLFLYSLGGGFVGLVAAGTMSHTGHLDITTSILVAMTANFLGDMLLFYLARYNKAEVWPYFKKHRRKLALSHLLMRRHGSKIILFQKFVYGIKTMVPLAIGFTKYGLTRFAVYNALSTVVWALTIGLVSFYLGEYVLLLFEAASEKPYLVPVFVFIILGSVYYYFSRTTKKKTPLRSA